MSQDTPPKPKKKPHPNFTRRPTKLNEKQLIFCDRYLVHFNATKAAIEAGYSKKTSWAYAHQLLKSPLVQKFLNDARKKSENKNAALRKRVMDELSTIAFSRLTDYGSWSESGMTPLRSDDIDQEKLAAVQEFSVNESPTAVNAKIKLYDKCKALEMLGRHLGMFNDKLKVELPKPTIVERFDGSGSVELGAVMTENDDGQD